MSLETVFERIDQEKLDKWLEDHFLDEIVSNSKGWKHFLERKGKTLAYRYVLESLDSDFELGLDEETLIPSDSNRRTFAKHYDFKEVEKLVYDSTHSAELLKILAKHPDLALFQQWIEFTFDALTNLSIPPAKARMAISNGNLIVVIGMRIVTSLGLRKDRYEVSFILHESQLDPSWQTDNTYRYKGKDNLVFPSFRVSSWNEIPAQVLEKAKEAFQVQFDSVKELPRTTSWNREAKTTNDALKYVVFEKVQISEWLEEEKLKTPPKDIFADVMEDIRQKLPTKKSPVSKLKIGKVGNRHVWVSTAPNQNPIQKCHYEFINRNGQLRMELHFEGSLDFNRRIHSALALPINLESFKWRKAYSIRHKEKVSIDDPAASEKLIELLQDMDAAIGESLRRNMGKTPRFEERMEQFEDWLGSNRGKGTRKLAKKTIKNYSEGATTSIRDMVEKKLIRSEESFCSILDPGMLSKLKETYFSIPQVREKDMRGKDMYSAAFNRYIEFIPTLKKEKHVNHPINQILYGPPGTGKTYNTLSHSLAIHQGSSIEEVNQESRADLKAEYSKLVDDDQILFTTFHQSMSYEDFVEGIKPVYSEKDSKNNGKISYEVAPGIFKIACARAALNAYINQQEQGQKLQSANTFSQLHAAFVDKARKGIENGEFLICKTLRGQEVEIYDVNDADSIRARAKGSSAVQVAPLTKQNLQKLYDEFDDVSEIKNLKDVKDTVGVSPRITEFYAVFKSLKKFEKEEFELDLEESSEELLEFNLSDREVVEEFDQGVYDKALKRYGKDSKPVVLIIDEINRGNVSAIFGELITLLEEDKRAGEANEIKVKLPYSKEYFKVPPNLYLIGTMNTADRSVEALDTALRRRFSFTEMMPKPELLTPSAVCCRFMWKYENLGWDDEQYSQKEELLFEMLEPSEDWKENRKSIWAQMETDRDRSNLERFAEFDSSGIKLNDVLRAMNERIEQLIDRDHTIGHSYFIGVYNLDALKVAFKDKVIPLLQEYFYGDYGKIGLVLGEGFVKYSPADPKVFFPLQNYQDRGDLARDRFVLKDLDHPDFNIQSAIQTLLNESSDE